MSFIQCSGCHKTFGNRGYSQHIAKTQNLRCRLSYTVPDTPCAPLIPPIPPIPPIPQSMPTETLHDPFQDDMCNIDISMEDSTSTVPVLGGEYISMREGIC